MSSNQTISRFSLPAAALTNIQYKLQGKYIRIDSSDDKNAVITIAFSSPNNPTLSLRVGAQYAIPDAYRDDENNTFRMFVTKAATQSTVSILVSDSELPDRTEISRQYTRTIQTETLTINASKQASITISKRSRIESIWIQFVSLTGPSTWQAVYQNSSGAGFGGFASDQNAFSSSDVCVSGAAKLLVSSSFEIFPFQPVTLEANDTILFTLGGSAAQNDTLKVNLLLVEEV